ncbi:MAG: hypothetical protein J6P46_08550 [Bacteroidales bacterium]|nr:hypothetical protein [Bacteroidales bacterium]
MAKNKFIPLDTALALADEYVSNLDDLCALRDSLEVLNPADVIPRKQMSDSVEEALIALDTFFNEGEPVGKAVALPATDIAKEADDA